MKVADLTVEEFRALVRETVYEAIDEVAHEDPEGVLRPEVRRRLIRSLAAPGPAVALEDFAGEPSGTG